MKIWFAGNFPLMKDPEKEKAQMKKILSLYPSYNRLISYYFKEDAMNLINIKKEFDNESQS